ncbi:unnamed protein product [Moneuplotes crassus]|uniref:Timeless N-terminal domain-containing protein n=1 Tax=Euplotes crassus TaxID=5936 RepID=A0AAD2D780_EUPCR|nr:unnamed protein product [Moneuplotes crassus]
MEDLEEIRQDFDETKVYSELLFCVQNVGKFKKIQDIDVFVKGDHCEENLKDISRFLRNDNPHDPVIRKMLNSWDFLKDSLLPLLLSQKQDIKLSFYVILLITEITYPFEKTANNYQELVQSMRQHKRAFLVPGVIKTLSMHLSDGCRGDTKIPDDKNSQLVELVIVIFKNLLQIPKAKSDEDESFSYLLLKNFKEESVFDSFIYMSAQLQSEFSKKLSFHFLEIFFHIFKDYYPHEFFSLTKKKTLKDYMKKEIDEKKKRQTNRSSRHSRFGTNIVLKDKKNSEIKRMVAGIPNDNLMRQKDIGRTGIRKKKAIKSDFDTGMLIHYRNMDNTSLQGDNEQEKMRQDLKELAIDLVEQSFNNFIDTLLEMIYSGNNDEVKANEIYMYIKINAFFLCMNRLNSQEKYKEEMQEYMKKERGQRGPKPILKIPVAFVRSAMKTQNIDFIFSQAYFNKMETRQKDRKMDIFLAAMEYFIELFYCVRDMDNSPHEKSQKNARTIKEKLATLQMHEVAKFGLDIYDRDKFQKYFMHTMIRYTNVLLEVMEKFCDNKMVLMKVQRTRKTKTALEGEEEMDYQDLNYEEVRFSLKATLMDYATYGIIENVNTCLELPEALDEELIKAISCFYNRIMVQIKGTWIFYQLDTLNSFDLFLSQYRKELKYQQLINTIKKILGNFFDRCKDNPLLPFEIMFKFPSRETKDYILTNYEFHNQGDDLYDDNQYRDDIDEDEAVLDDIDKYKETISKSGWQADEEANFLEYYDIFKDSDDCAQKIAKILNKPIEAIVEKMKELKLKAGVEETKIESTKDKKSMDPPKKRDTESFKDCKVATQNVIKKMIKNELPHEEIIKVLEHFVKIFDEYLNYEEAKDQKDDMFYHIPLTENEKTTIYSKPVVKNYVQEIGFVDEMGEYSMDIGSQPKIKKIIKWIKKGISKVKKLSSKPKDEDDVAEGLLNGEIDVDEVI